MFAMRNEFRSKWFLCIVCAVGFVACSAPAPRTVPIPPDAKSEAPIAPPPVGAFKLFPTQNVWTQLKLDTRDGRVWQVSISPDSTPSDYAISLVPRTDQPYIGRFTLEPTKNIWNFVMLDTSDGRTWQVQWGNNRFVQEMNK